jgi:hypothetical protein
LHLNCIVTLTQTYVKMNSADREGNSFV